MRFYKKIRAGEETSDAYQKAIEQRVQRTLHVTVDRLVEWSKRSDFDTKYLEQDFGRQGGWDPIRVPLGENRYLRLIGQIDRIDEYTRDGQTYGMVIDYKSGGAHVTAQDVYYGLKLQLMTYLLALESAYGKTARRIYSSRGCGVFLCEESLKFLQVHLYLMKMQCHWLRKVMHGKIVGTSQMILSC